MTTTDKETAARAMGRRFKDARTEKGWSLSKAAQEAGVDRTTIIRLEQGRAPNPHGDTVDKLAVAYGVRLGWLLLGEYPIPAMDGGSR